MNVSIRMRWHSRFYNKYVDPTLRWRITYVPERSSPRITIFSIDSIERVIYLQSCRAVKAVVRASSTRISAHADSSAARQNYNNSPISRNIVKSTRMSLLSELRNMLFRDGTNDCELRTTVLARSHEPSRKSYYFSARSLSSSEYS